jgi:hypothetical protein
MGMTPNDLAVCLLMFGLIQTFSVTTVNAQSKADKLRAIERGRLRSLVAADIATARRLHADDFELIHPRGGTLSKEEYTANKDFKVLSFVPKTVDFPFRSTSLL